MPEGLWIKCKACATTIYMKDLVNDLQVCKSCGYHFAQPSEDRARTLFDEGTFKELWPSLKAMDRLGFVDKEPYPIKLQGSAKKSGIKEAAIAGTGLIERQPAAICMLDFRFMGGSMGTVVGEKVTRTFELALTERIPAIVVSCSGGARMHEGALSLMQMAKTSAAIARLHDAGGLYISVLANPTTGGVMASFAALGDLIFAEPGALIGFAGPRVIQETLRTELPEGFQTSEFLLERGFIDRIVPRAKLRVELGRSIRLLWTYDKKTLDSFNVEELSTTSKPETVATLAETKVIDTVRGLKSSEGEASQAEEA
jgi:acetyl-CoA carboxylase carboxyl transferase subunit beta